MTSHHPQQLAADGTLEPNPEYLAAQETLGGAARYTPKQIEALDQAIAGPLAEWMSGASTAAQAVSGRYGAHVQDLALTFIESVENCGDEFDVPLIARDFADRLHDHHMPIEGGDLSETFASRDRPRDFEIAEARDAEALIEPGSFGSATLDEQAVSTFQAAFIRELNKGRPKGEDISFDEHDELMQRPFREEPSAADPDDADDGPGQGLAMDSDGIFYDPVEMANDADVRATFEAAHDAAGRVLSQGEVEEQEAALGLDTRQLDRAHVAACVANITGPQPGDILR